MSDPTALSTRFLFFTGKGGVGKTTLACATALRIADQGARILLVSTDPASNLDEMLGQRLGSRPTRVSDALTLDGMNVDPEAAATEYRRRALGQYEGVVSETEMATMREELGGACTVEIAAFDRFAGLLAGEDDESASYDRIVFDTAPTGHTLRLLDLPRAWTTFLDANTRGASCLGPHGGLMTRHARFRAARAALEDPSVTTVVLVSRAELTALREAERTAHELVGVGLKNQRLVINGTFAAVDHTDPVARAFEAREGVALESLPPALGALPRDEVPLRAFEILGLDALRAVLDPTPCGVTVEPGEGAGRDLPGLALLADELEAAPKGLVLVTGKGGVGKTTIAAALATELAGRGVDVLLCTTDPAAHLVATVGESVAHLEVTRVDPRAEVARYVEHVMQTKGASLDRDGRAALEEDLRSPCTEEVAVFHAFSRVVSQARGRLVVLDTAPTGHTLRLLDATGSYHRDVLRGSSPTLAAKTITPLMRLRDRSFTRVVLVTLAETTPVSEGTSLQEDLRRAGIEPWAWVVNGSLVASAPRDPILRARAAIQRRQLDRGSRVAWRAVAWSFHGLPSCRVAPRRCASSSATPTPGEYDYLELLATRYPTPRTVSSRPRRSPSFFRIAPTWTSMLRSMTELNWPATTDTSRSRVNTRPPPDARKWSKRNSAAVSATETPSTTTSCRAPSITTPGNVRRVGASSSPSVPCVPR